MKNRKQKVNKCQVPGIFMISFDELAVWIVSSLLLGLILSTQFHWPVLFIEPADFILMFAFSLVMLFIFVAGQKIAAHFYNCEIKVKWLSFRQYWFRDQYRLKWPFPLWVVLPVLLFLITLGNVKWLAILNFDVEVKSSRIRKRFSNIDDIDVAKIAAAGPLASIIFALFLKIIGLTSLAAYPALLAFLSCIPIGMGAKILCGSRNLAVFLFVLTGFMFLLVPLTGWIASLALSVLVAIFILVTYYIIYER